jgi:hypothetical protein
MDEDETGSSSIMTYQILGTWQEIHNYWVFDYAKKFLVESTLGEGKGIGLRQKKDRMGSERERERNPRKITRVA